MPRSTPHLGGLCALILVTVALGSCSGDDGDAADPTPSSTTTTTVATPATTTTLAPVPLALVVSREGLLGWWQDGSWVDAEVGQPTPVRGGERYTVVGLDGPESSTVGSAVGTTEEFCRVPRVDLDPGLPEPAGGVEELSPVAVHGVASPRPRPTVVLHPGSSTHRAAAAAVLADLGIDDPDPDLAQVVRADLTGDGTDEVLVVAERLADPGSVLAVPGDYSVLFLRQVVDGEVRTTVIEEHRNEAQPEGPSPYLVAFRVGAAVDLNGDGVLEVVVEEQYYEGNGTSVHAVGADGSLAPVMGGGCGV